jgi:hypothetical protein
VKVKDFVEKAPKKTVNLLILQSNNPSFLNLTVDYMAEDFARIDERISHGQSVTRDINDLSPGVKAELASRLWSDSADPRLDPSGRWVKTTSSGAEITFGRTDDGGRRIEDIISFQGKDIYDTSEQQAGFRRSEQNSRATTGSGSVRAAESGPSISSGEDGSRKVFIECTDAYRSAGSSKKVDAAVCAAETGYKIP